GSAFHTENPVLGAPAVRDAARRLDATPAQVALAWLLAQATTVLLIPGTSSPEHLAQNLAVAELSLDAESMAALNSVADGAPAT
ncbi:MAG: aldo/keto reductase, partial [Actinomycetota bacterium]|nr:aldo/keto reductase [Actinomycetota bacterium]